MVEHVTLAQGTRSYPADFACSTRGSTARRSSRSLFALIVCAFSLQDRPRPLGTTLAPDAFDGVARAGRPRRARRAPIPTARARATAATRRWPPRLAAGVPRDGLAYQVSDAVASAAETADGERHADDGHRRARSASPGRASSSSPTATRSGAGRARSCRAPRRCSSSRAWSRGGRLRRTMTFVSTSGGSAGAAGARDLAAPARRPADAVLVLGDVARRHGAPAVRDRLVDAATGRPRCSCAARSRPPCARRPATNPGGARATLAVGAAGLPGHRRASRGRSSPPTCPRCCCRSAASARRRPTTPIVPRPHAGLRPRRAARADRAGQRARRSRAGAEPRRS